MDSRLCFTSALPVRHGRELSLSHRSRVVCTLAPERSTSKESSTKSYRVLPPDLPETARPPPPPRHRSIPYVGYLIDGFLGRPARMHELILMYGPVFSTNFFMMEQTYVSGYEAVTEIMRSPEVFASAGALGSLEMLLTDALITLDGAQHAAARGLLAPAFSTALFPSYFPFVSRRSRSLWDEVHRAAMGNDTVTLFKRFQEHYLNVTIEMTTGLNMEGGTARRIPALFDKLQYGFLMYRLGPLAKPYVDARDELVNILVDVIRDNLSHGREAVEKLHSYGENMSKEGAKALKKGEMNVLLVAIAASELSTESGAKLDENVIESLARSVILLWLAGYWTSAATSATAVLQFLKYPEVHQRLIAEQDGIVATAGGVRDVTYEQTVSEMPLLESFLTEVLRLHPPISAMGRVAARDVEILGRLVPKGSKLICSFESSQLDPSAYPDPHGFIPERFMQKPKPPPVLAFGPPGSPHFCIGYHFAKCMMHCTFGTLQREYTIVLDPKQSRNLRYLPDVSPKSGVVVKELRKRRT